MCLPKPSTFCLVNTGCSARLRGAHSLLGREKRLSPARFRTSSWIWHRSVSSSVRPNTSRTPLGEVTSTRAGATNFGSGTKRVTGPPASLSSASPVCKTRAADSTCRMGSGFFGASGSAPMSSLSIVALMTPRIISVPSGLRDLQPIPFSLLTSVCVSGRHAMAMCTLALPGGHQTRRVVIFAATALSPEVAGSNPVPAVSRKRPPEMTPGAVLMPLVV